MKKQSLLFLISVFILGCDWEVYTGYNFSAPELSGTIHISGYITHYYTGDSVDAVLVRIGNQETHSDHNGYYHIEYELSDDELRNKPTEFSYEKENYFTFSQSALLMDTDTEFNIRLKYAAPIVVATARPYITPTHLVCQAIVRDYQGLDNLESVQVAYHFQKDNPQEYDTLRVDLELHKSPEFGLGYYQKFADYLGEEMFYYIEVKDKDGYSTRLLHSIRPNHPDRPIFDPYE